MIVSEYETGDIVIYNITTMPAVELGRLSTGLSSVQGIKIGPDGRIWFVDGFLLGVNWNSALEFKAKVQEGSK